MKLLAKETAIYGLSSIIGKFLNWMLVPLYTYVLKAQSDYGIVTNLYAWTALLLVILTYGMETGFFRFANKEGEDPAAAYTTALTSLFVTSSIFAIVCVTFQHSIASFMGYDGHEEFIALLAIVVAMDAFASIPFAYLRYKKRSIRFAALKLLFVGLNILLNFLFLVILKWTDVRYVFIANFIATSIQTLCLLPTIFAERFCFSWSLLRRMLRYSLPLLVLGICGIMNQTLDRILFPYLYSGEDAEAQLGIYGACFKVAMVMMMFTQAFRYAYEPFVFAKHKDRQSIEAYADAMKYYIIFSLLIVLGMVVYLDLLKFLIAPTYWGGLKIVPIVLWTYVFQGIYFNLSFWYKLTDKTQYGAWFSMLGVVITLVLQILFVPHIGYIASAASSAICYMIIMLLSYFIGRHYLPIPYDFKRIGMYTLICVAMLAVYYMLPLTTWAHMAAGTLLIAIYCLILYKCDFYVFRNR